MKDIILIDKSAGWTSFDVVAKVRSELRRKQSLALRSQKIETSSAISVKAGIQPSNTSNASQNSPLSSKNSGLRSKIKVGHAGTLDPFATGLLIILLGDACKQAGEFLKLDKTYEFTAKLGEVSTTGDPEGIITPYAANSKQQIANRMETEEQRPKSVPSVIPAKAGIQSAQHERSEVDSVQISSIKYPSIDEVQRVLKQFIGEIEQTPPAYSAIKIDGKRAYKLAREGKKVEIPSRKVRVDRLELVSYEYPYLKCVCNVSSGTYIRTLVEDIGKNLKTGAYCQELRRTRIGEYKIENAGTINELAQSLSAQ